MAELEKVIKAWECCNPLNRRCFECPYDADCFHDSFDRVAIADMVELLKDQKNLIDGLIEDQLKKDEEQQSEIDRLKAEQPKKGHWIEQEGFDGDSYYDCSVCGESWVLIDGTPKENGMDYCPHCGADMRKDGDGE